MGWMGYFKTGGRGFALIPILSIPSILVPRLHFPFNHPAVSLTKEPWSLPRYRGSSRGRAEAINQGAFPAGAAEVAETVCPHSDFETVSL